MRNAPVYTSSYSFCLLFKTFEIAFALFKLVSDGEENRELIPIKVGQQAANLFAKGAGESFQFEGHLGRRAGRECKRRERETNVTEEGHA